MIDSGIRSFYEAEDGTAKAYGLVGLSQVIDPDEIAEVEFVEFSEATVWGDIPDEIVAEEYSGEIPFERIYPGEEQHWFINLLK